MHVLNVLFLTSKERSKRSLQSYHKDWLPWLLKKFLFSVDKSSLKGKLSSLKSEFSLFSWFCPWGADFLSVEALVFCVIHTRVRSPTLGNQRLLVGIQLPPVFFHFFLILVKSFFFIYTKKSVCSTDFKVFQWVGSCRLIKYSLSNVPKQNMYFIFSEKMEKRLV